MDQGSGGLLQVARRAVEDEIAGGFEELLEQY